MKRILVLWIFTQAANVVYSQPICDFQGKDSLYVNIIGDTIQVWDIAACGYCNSSFALSVATSADTIYIVQTDTVKDVALCGCIFDLRTSIVGLSAGTYWVALYRDWPKRNIHQFIRAVQFTYTPATIQSLQWYGYQSGCIVDAVTEEEFQRVQDFDLLTNYPNPFNPTTTIEYFLPKESDVKIVVSDILGREIRTLVEEKEPAGKYSIQFNGNNLSSGIYFYRLQTKEFVKTKKLILMK